MTEVGVMPLTTILGVVGMRLADSVRVRPVTNYIQLPQQVGIESPRDFLPDHIGPALPVGTTGLLRFPVAVEAKIGTPRTMDDEVLHSGCSTIDREGER